MQAFWSAVHSSWTFSVSVRRSRNYIQPSTRDIIHWGLTLKVPAILVMGHVGKYRNIEECKNMVTEVPLPLFNSLAQGSTGRYCRLLNNFWIFLFHHRLSVRQLPNNANGTTTMNTTTNTTNNNKALSMPQPAALFQLSSANDWF